MKLKLVAPGQLDYYKIEGRPIWYYRLALPIVAAVTPPDWEVLPIVEGKGAYSLDYDEDVDVVGMSFLTPFALDAYQIADAYRERGKTVIFGGVHASAVPQEAKQHADSVVIGEPEMIWPQILEDFKRGELQDFYRQSEPTKLESMPVPRRDLLDPSNYANYHHVIPTRGCNIGCGFCVVPWLHGKSFRFNPIERVIQEIKSLPNLDTIESIITSENFLSHKKYALELFKAIEPLEITWGAAAYLPHLRDESFLDAAKKAGCMSYYIETEMVSKKKDPKMLEAYQDATRKMVDRGLNVLLNFTVGYDDDSPEIFEETVRFVQDYAPRGFSIQILTPWPETALFKRLEEEGRILHRNWKYYDNGRVVYKPKKLSMGQLQKGFFDVYKSFESIRETFQEQTLL